MYRTAVWAQTCKDMTNSGIPWRVHGTHVIIPYHRAVVGALPHTIHEVADRKYLRLPYTVAAVNYLRTLNCKIPAPILYDYTWPGTEPPMESQKLSAAFLTSYRRAYVTSEIGTGKTRVPIYAFDYLRARGEATRMLVLAPLSTLSFTWEAELLATAPHLKVELLYGSRAKRLQRLKNDADVYVMNHEGLRVFSTIKRVNKRRIARLDPELADRLDIDCILVDESDLFANGQTAMWTGLDLLLQGRKWAWAMTGTPMPHGPTDVWAQCKLFTPETMPVSFSRFRMQTMRQITDFRWEPKDDGVATARAAMQPAIRFTRDQCMDLPPHTVSRLEAEMSIEQDKAYKDMAKDLVYKWARGEISAANKGVQLFKLLQICCGFLYGEDGEIVDLDDAPRMALLNRVIQESVGKVIVFLPFTHAIERISSGIEAATAIVDGSVSKTARDKIFNAFQNEAEPRVLVAHPGTMQRGLTLTEANTIVWYTPFPGLRMTLQAEGRITRRGQTRNTHVFYLLKTKIEQKVFARLQAGKSVQSMFLDMVESGTPLQLKDIL